MRKEAGKGGRESESHSLARPLGRPSLVVKWFGVAVAPRDGDNPSPTTTPAPPPKKPNLLSRLRGLMNKIIDIDM